MTPEVKKALTEFRLCGSAPLSFTGVDAVHQILPMIYGLSTALALGYQKDEEGKSCLEELNPELSASALGGIAYLASLAMFHADNL